MIKNREREKNVAFIENFNFLVIFTYDRVMYQMVAY